MKFDHGSTLIFPYKLRYEFINKQQNRYKLFVNYTRGQKKASRITVTVNHAERTHFLIEGLFYRTISLESARAKTNGS